MLRRHTDRVGKVQSTLRSRRGWAETLMGTGIVAAVLAVTAAITGLTIWLIGAPAGGLVFVPALFGTLWVGDHYAVKRAHHPKFGSVRAVIGSDGLVVTPSLGRRFVAFADLESVVVDQGKLVLALTSGKLLRLKVIQPERGAQVIREAKSCFAKRERTQSIGALSGASEQGWAARLSADSSDGYRKDAVPIEVLVRIAEDPGALAEQRVGAALALAAASPAIRRRVRVAIEQTVDGLVAGAMSEAIEGDLRESTRKRLLTV